MQLEIHAAVPLLIGHLKDVDLRHRPGDVEQRIDTAELGNRFFDNSFCR